MTAQATARTAAATAASAAARRGARELERGVHAGHVDLAAVLVALDEEVPGVDELRAAAARVRIERLLKFVPGVGDWTVTVICRRAQVDRAKRFGALASTERRRLALQLARYDVAEYAGNGPVRSVRS